jgi:16S rRNA (uracil1498-N3)-methyltransferase
MIAILPEPVAARLFVPADLAAGARVALDEGQAHYLKHVLRLGPGGRVGLFNGRDGEWRAVIAAQDRRATTLAVEGQSRPQAPEPDLWLLFAPVKRAPIDFVTEKATELGASALIPVLTRRTIASRVNTDRLAAIAREAAEQCERLTVPRIAEPVRLEDLPDLLDDRWLVVCDETGGRPIAEAVRVESPKKAAAILVGPEGGFAPGELDAILKLPFASRVGLGPRVLRADTAALAALAVFQALAGDWHSARPPV